VPCQKKEDAIIEMGGGEAVIPIRRKRRPHKWVEVIPLLHFPSIRLYLAGVRGREAPSSSSSSLF
jgi:hypothetical protein